MKKLSIENLAIQYLADQCKARHKAKEKFGIHYSINESFGAIVLACSSSFLKDRNSKHGFNSPKILKVNHQKQYVSHIEVEYNTFSEIEAIIIEHINLTESKPIQIQDPSAYKKLLELIKIYYPKHPTQTKLSEEGAFLKQRIINEPSILFKPDFLDLEENDDIKK